MDDHGIDQGFEGFGSNQSGMRDHNERLVLSILRRQGALPKAEIARKTGLSAQTVSVIMRALEADGLLQKGEKVRGKVGQPSVPMGLAPEGAFFLGLKVGRRSAELILVNFVGEELAHVTQSYEYPTPGAALDFVQSATAEVLTKLSPAQQSRVAGMGVASPFFLWEWAATIGVAEGDMASWKGFDLCEELSKRFDFPVYLENDATSACGAELTFGTVETAPDFLYIYIGYFVGGGVVLNGTLHSGRSGNAGAIGTFPVSTPGGGYHQLVDRASLIGLERLIQDRAGDASSRMGDTQNWNIPKDIWETWLSDAVPSLSQMILGAISIIDFPMVLIDGNMPARVTEEMAAKISDHLNAEAHPGLIMPSIRPGSLGSRARPLGAASLPLSKRFMLET